MNEADARALIHRALQDDSVNDVLDWDVLFPVGYDKDSIGEELWDRVEGKIFLVLGAIFPEVGDDPNPGIGAYIGTFEPEDARHLGQALIAMADAQGRSTN